MTRSKVLSSFGLLSLLTSILCFASRDAMAQESCVSGSCHATVVKGKTIHAATQSCEACHESVATPHPQVKQKTFKLTQEPPGLCFDCHEPLGKKNHVHAPVKEGMCTTCHDPHASQEAKLLTQPLQGLCQSCHADKVSAKHVHGPVSAGACTACHAPHESDAKSLLLKPGEQLCFDCHADVQGLLKKKVVHPAMEGGCTSCHEPHGAANPKLLAESGGQLCFSCHDPIAEKVQKAAVVHAAVKDEKGCANCHSPHASDDAKLLLKPEKETCLGCHPAILTKSMTVLHGPIADGKCTPCHDPHGGPYPKLLTRDFPPDAYVAYTDTEFGLCFSCHKRDLVQYPDTSFATGFRDGDKNLHYLHVNNKQKGRSCALCHAIHGGVSPKLISENVSFGKWKLPLKFVKTATGGSCAPGCHKPSSYDRQKPAAKPGAPKPAATGN